VVYLRRAVLDRIEAILERTAQRAEANTTESQRILEHLFGRQENGE
jgi:hypothetical protein